MILIMGIIMFRHSYKMPQYTGNELSDYAFTAYQLNSMKCDEKEYLYKTDWYYLRNVMLDYVMIAKMCNENDCEMLPLFESKYDTYIHILATQDSNSIKSIIYLDDLKGFEILIQQLKEKCNETEN